MTTFERVRALIAQALEIEESTITLDSKIVTDLHASSMDLVEIFSELGQMHVPLLVSLEEMTVGQVVEQIDNNPTTPTTPTLPT